MVKGAEDHWDMVRKLVNNLLGECITDAAEMIGGDVTFSDVAYLAGKLFDARWQGIVHDTDAGLFKG